MVLEAEIDDEARPDRHGGDEKDHRAAARRPAEGDAAALGEPKRREGRENDERRHAEDVAAEASQAVAASEAPAVVKIMRDDEVEIGPKRENAERQRSQRDVDDQRSAHRGR